jgi:DMSO/TMAO reductase YedYZ molybdopterin-dependent catalytic subunit
MTTATQTKVRQVPSTARTTNDLVRVEHPVELTLRPVEGLPRWLGPRLHRIALRLASMIEQPTRNMSGPLSQIEGYFRRDRYRHPKVDAESYRLRVTGVEQPRSLTLEDLRALPWEHRVLVMECAGNGNHMMGSAGLVGQARWSGPSLRTVIEACGGTGEATHFAFHGLDPIPLLRRAYHYGLSLDELELADALVAVEMNGQALPRARGFPVRLVVPGIYSMSHVKWLGHIEGKTRPHDGIHNRLVFTNKERRDGRWVRVQARWIGLKSLITRCQRTSEGWRLTGWAWGGGKPIDRVAITTDGGETWDETEVHEPTAYFGEADGIRPDDVSHAWSVFEYHWKSPQPGDYLIASRAYASDGTPQRMESDPDVKGHFNVTKVKWRRVVVPER